MPFCLCHLLNAYQIIKLIEYYYGEAVSTNQSMTGRRVIQVCQILRLSIACITFCLRHSRRFLDAEHSSRAVAPPRELVKEHELLDVPAGRDPAGEVGLKRRQRPVQHISQVWRRDDDER